MKRNFIIYGILYALIVWILKELLLLVKLNFLLWFYYASNFFILTMLIMGIFQLLAKIKFKFIRRFLKFIAGTLSIILILVTIFIHIIRFWGLREQIIIENFKIYVIEVDERWATDNVLVGKYDYINFLIRGTEVIEYYRVSK